MENFNDRDQNDSFESQMISTKLLPDIVGHICVAIIKHGRKFGSENAKFEEGEFYYINSDHKFCKWYRQARPYHQLFRSSDRAALFYARYFFEWKRLGSPSVLTV